MSASWDAAFEFHPGNIDVLIGHPVSPNEIVLFVRRPRTDDDTGALEYFPVITLSDRPAANRAGMEN